MRLMIKIFPALPVVFLLAGLPAEAAQEIVDIPTRPGVTQRVMLLEPDKPQAAVTVCRRSWRFANFRTGQL